MTISAVNSGQAYLASREMRLTQINPGVQRARPSAARDTKAKRRAQHKV